MKLRPVVFSLYLQDSQRQQQKEVWEGKTIRKTATITETLLQSGFFFFFFCRKLLFTCFKEKGTFSNVLLSNKSNRSPRNVFCVVCLWDFFSTIIVRQLQPEDRGVLWYETENEHHAIMLTKTQWVEKNSAVFSKLYHFSSNKRRMKFLSVHLCHFQGSMRCSVFDFSLLIEVHPEGKETLQGLEGEDPLL